MEKGTEKLVVGKSGLSLAEAKEIAAPGAYVYGLKHEDGEYTYSVGEDWEDAAKSIGWDPKKIRRCVPIKKKEWN